MIETTPLRLISDGPRDEDGKLWQDFGLIDNLVMVKGADAVLASFRRRSCVRGRAARQKNAIKRRTSSARSRRG